MLKPLGPAFIVAGFCLIGWAFVRAYLRLEKAFVAEAGPYMRQFVRLVLLPDVPGIAGAFYAGALMIAIGYFFVPGRE
jgi:hypothetical protein